MNHTSKVTFQTERWFAWFPVRLERGGWVWANYVTRDRTITAAVIGRWRYYA